LSERQVLLQHKKLSQAKKAADTSKTGEKQRISEAKIQLSASSRRVKAAQG
jgi:hypothetical protein